MRFPWFFTGVAVTIVTAATGSAPGAADDRALIAAARTAQNRAIAAGDLDRVASFWTDDVTDRRALGQPLAGRAAAREALQPAGDPAARLVYQRIAADIEV